MNFDSIDSFQQFVENEVMPATAELEKIAVEDSRKHIQKLIFANLVDRFDVVVDETLLDNAKDEKLLADALKDLNNPLTEAELIRLLIKGDDLQTVALEKLKNSLRNSLLKQRHSKKLSKIFGIMNPQEDVWNKPRVNISTGRILSKIKPQNKSIPYSICGYSDWLYSRRNAVVHGGGKSFFLRNDVEQLKKLFKCNPSKNFKLQPSSIKNAAQFYIDMCLLLKNQNEGKS